MSKDEIGYQTTIRAAPGVDGQRHFAGRRRIADRLLAASLPVLWGLVALVVVVVLFW